MKRSVRERLRMRRRPKPPVDTNLYNLADAASLPPFETETIGSGWTNYRDTSFSLYAGYNSNSAIRIQYDKNEVLIPEARLVFDSLEVGESYNISMDAMGLNSNEDGPGYGRVLFSYSVGGGWETSQQFDVYTNNWHRIEVTVKVTIINPFMKIHPSISNSSAYNLYSVVLDNILIEKIS